MDSVRDESKRKDSHPKGRWYEMNRIAGNKLLLIVLVCLFALPCLPFGEAGKLGRERERKQEKRKVRLRPSVQI